MSNDFRKFANSFQAIARLELEGISCLMKHLGDPQKDLKFIHIAGTNGKGSVCNFLQSIFTCSGRRTGRYTSPNLVSVCERIAIDGELIGEADINRVLSRVEEASKAVEAEIGDRPTQFEIWTAAAFCYFKEQNCDMVILETGLGGTRDATNVIPPPVASVITSIDIDHVEYLGGTLEAIAGEKAGIIKKGCPLTVSAPQQPDGERVLKEHCSKKENKLIFSKKPELKFPDGFYEVFDYTAADGKEFSDIKCGIAGAYQPRNAAVAIETANALGIAEEHIREGIGSASNPGRFEIIQKKPVVIYDGAHNPNGMTALAECLNRYFPRWDGATFIMAFMGDKDISGELRILKDSGLMDGSRIFAVKVEDNPRGAETALICRCAQAEGMDATPFGKLADAYYAALETGKPVILCGSLYLYKDFSRVRINNN